MTEYFVQIVDENGKALSGRRVTSRTLILDAKGNAVLDKHNRPMTHKTWENTDSWPLERVEDKNGDPRLSAYIVCDLDGSEGFAAGNLSMSVKTRSARKAAKSKTEDFSTEELEAELAARKIATPQ